MRFSSDSDWIKQNPDEVCKYVAERNKYLDEIIACLLMVSRSNLECLELLNRECDSECDKEDVRSVMNTLAEKTRYAMKFIDEYFEY